MDVRYMCGEQHTVNGLTAYRLGVTQTDTEKVAHTLKGGNFFKWGMKLWKRDVSGVESEITDGYSALVERTVAGEGIQGAGWNMPTMRIGITDALVLRVYEYSDIYGWTLLSTFITEQNPSIGEVWTVFYYTKFLVGYAWFFWGTAGKNSRVEAEIVVNIVNDFLTLLDVNWDTSTGGVKPTIANIMNYRRIDVGDTEYVLIGMVEDYDNFSGLGAREYVRDVVLSLILKTSEGSDRAREMLEECRRILKTTTLWGDYKNVLLTRSINLSDRERKVWSFTFVITAIKFEEVD